jgi:hypothetical protein
VLEGNAEPGAAAEACTIQVGKAQAYNSHVPELAGGSAGSVTYTTQKWE